MKHGKHVVMLNVEADVTIGRFLKEEADKTGVVFNGVAGDEAACGCRCGSPSAPPTGSCRRGAGLPPLVALRRRPGTGHMPQREAAGTMAAILAQALRG